MPDPNDPLEQFYANNPGLRPGAAAGGAFGAGFANPAAPVAPPARGNAPAPPAAPPPIPNGFVPSPMGNGRAVSTDGNKAISLNPQTNQWEPERYAPSAAELAQLGIHRGGTSGGGGGINYAEQRRPSDQTKEDLIARGGRQLGDNTIIVPSKSGGGDKYTLGNNGYWGPFGRASYTDMVQLGNQIRQDIASGKTITPGSLTPQEDIITAMAQPRPSTAPGVPGAAGQVGTLQGNQAPLLSSFDWARQPGLGIPSEGRRTMYTGSEMNTLRPTLNGPALPHFGVSGIRPPTATGNNYNFTPQSSFPSYARFGDVPFSVPSTYQPGPSGFTLDTNGGAFQAFGIPFGITAPSATSPGGAGVAVLQGPQNLTISSPDKSVGYGLLVNSPFAYNNIGATYGRELGGVNRDAATGAIESLLLANAQAKYGPEGAMRLLTAVDPGAYTGQPGLYGNLPMEGGGVATPYGEIFGGFGGTDAPTLGGYARGGTLAMRGPRMPGPLGRADQVIPEPSMIVGMMTGHPYATMSEKGMEPIRDMGNGMMRISPAPRRYDDGGDVVSLGQLMGELGRLPAPNDQWINPFGGGFLLPNYYPDMPIYIGGGPQQGWFNNPQLTYQPGTWTPQPPVERPYLIDPWEPYADPRSPIQSYADGGTVKWINQYGETTELDPGVSPGSGWSQLNPPPPAETPAPPIEQPQTQPPPPQLVPIDYGGMNYNTNTGVQNWSQPPANQPTNNLPNGTNDNLPGPIIPIDNGGISVLTGFDPLNPNILTPYQQALQRETMAQHLRDTVDNPRRAAAGLGRSTGIEVLPGQTPAEPLGAGMFYNMTPQLQQAANDIASRQREIAALDQADPNWSRIVQLGNALDDMDRIRALEVVKAGDLGTASVTPTTATGVSTAGLEEQLKKLEYDAQLIAANHNSFEAAQQLGYDSPRAAAEQAAAVRNQLLHAQAAASTDATYAAQRIANADAQIAELRNRLPAGADQAAYRAELANLMSQQNRSQQRVNLVNEVANLVKRGVPSLSGPILPVAA